MEVERNKKITTTLSFSWGTVRVSRYTLEVLNYPLYIMTLINEKKMMIAFHPTTKDERCNIAIRYTENTKVAGKHYNSVRFVRKVYKLGNWDRRYRYQIPGEYIEKSNTVVFDLSQATMIVGSQDEEQNLENKTEE